jgi:hypothetical protein
MPVIRIGLHRKGKEPLFAQADVDAKQVHPDLLDTHVGISVGDGIANGTIMVPLEILSALMAKVMAKAGSQPGIVVPKPPAIVIPN